MRPMRVREVEDEAERSRLWKLAIAAYPPYAEYQERTARWIPVFIAVLSEVAANGLPDDREALAPGG